MGGGDGEEGRRGYRGGQMGDAEDGSCEGRGDVIVGG